MNSSLQKKESLNWFILIETIFCVLIVWFICSKNANMASNVFTVSFIVLLYYFIKYFFARDKIIDELDGYLIAIIVASFFSVFISLLMSGKGVNFENLKQYFIFLATVIFFRLAEKMSINRKTANYIFLLNMLISAIYLYAKRAFPQEYLQFSSNALTLNFSNPNLTGMFIGVSLIYMVLGVFYFRNILLKIFCVVLAFSDFYLLLETEARNPLVALVLFAGILILSFLKTNLRFLKGFNFLVNITPIAFVAFYLTFIDAIIKKGWLDFLISSGKTLTSRVGVWKEVLEGIGNDWLFGNYVVGSGNAHNSQLVLLAGYGIIGLVLTITYTYKMTTAISNRITGKFQLYALTAFFAVIFMGFGEGALYSGGVGLYLLCGGFIILANSDFEHLNVKRR